MCVRRELIDPSADHLSFLKHKVAHKFQSRVTVSIKVIHDTRAEFEEIK